MLMFTLQPVWHRDDEYTNKPILDKNGELIPLREYYIDGINCDPFTFDVECKELNLQYAAYQNLHGYKNELKTVCANVDAILGKGHTRQHEPEKSQDIS